MSGGVDSAVALLRARPKALGVTLRLWLDPAGPDAERACCSPEAVIAARETCHALGIPHVTLDLREEFRAAVVEPFVEVHARGETPNPCGRCNGSFRFDKLLAFTDRAGAATLWTDVTTHRSSTATVAACSHGPRLDKDQSYMLAPFDPAVLDRVEFPLGGQTKAQTRAEAAASGLEVAERREPGGVLPRRRLSPSSSGTASSAPRSDRRRAETARPPRRRLALHPGPAPRESGQAPEPLYALRTDRASNTLVVGPRGSARLHGGGCPRFTPRPGRPSRGEAPLPLRAGAGSRRRARRRVHRASGFRRRARPDRGSLRRWGRRRGVRCRVVGGSALGFQRAPPCCQRRRRCVLRPRGVPHLIRDSPSHTHSCAWAEPSAAFPRSSEERNSSCFRSSTRSARVSAG